MTGKHHLLHRYHDDTANLMVSDLTPCFWVLDLEDRIGFELAVASGKSPEQLADHRQSILETDCIPALTLGMGLEASNRILASGWNISPLPGGRYVVVVSDGRVSVRALPST